MATFVNGDLAAAAEQELAASQLTGIRWEVREGAAADDGFLGPVMSTQMPDAADAGQPAERQPLTLVVETPDREAAWQAASVLRHSGAAQVELYLS